MFNKKYLAGLFISICLSIWFSSCENTAPENSRALPLVFSDSLLAEIDSFQIEIFNSGNTISPVQVLSGSTVDLQRDSSGVKNTLMIKLSDKIGENFTITIIGFTNDVRSVKKEIIIAKGQNPVIENKIVESQVSDSSLDLRMVSLTPGSIFPDFNSDSTRYRVSVDGDIKQISLLAVLKDSTSSMFIENIMVKSGDPHLISGLSPGEVNIEVKVISADKAGRIYTFAVNIQDFTPVKLKNLTPSIGVLSPGFHRDTTGYSLNLLYTDSILKITPSKISPDAVVKVENVEVPDNKNSQELIVKTGTDTISILISLDKMHWGYNIYTKRDNKPSSKLSYITPSVGKLVPEFTDTVTNYTLSLPYSQDNLNLTAKSEDSKSVIKLNGEYLKSGEISNTQLLSIGNNGFNLKVTAYDSSATTYTLNVIRDKKPTALLDSLIVSNGVLTPEFNPDTLTYNVFLPYGVSGIFLTPRANSSYTITCNGDTLGYGASTENIMTSIGDTNKVTLTVSADSGHHSSTYKIKVTQLLSSNANLSLLSACTFCSMNPAFDSNTTEYLVSNFRGDLAIKPFTAFLATITINEDTIPSGDSYKISSELIKTGPNTISVLVTAMDGKNQKTYTITAIKPGSEELPDFTSCSDVQISKTALHNSMPYVVYDDCKAGGKLTVKKYLNGAWETVGKPGISAGPAGYRTIEMALKNVPELEIKIFNNIVYIAYLDRQFGQKLTVKQYADSSWFTLGREGFSKGNISNLSMVLNTSGRPTIAYSDAGTIKMQSFSSSIWNDLDAPLNLGQMEISNTGAIYMAFTHNKGASVLKYAGGIWVELSSSGLDSIQNFSVIKLAVSKETVFLAFQNMATNIPVLKIFEKDSWSTVRDFNSFAPKIALNKLSSASALPPIPSLELAVSIRTRQIRTREIDHSIFIGFDPLGGYGNINAFVKNEMQNFAPLFPRTLEEFKDSFSSENGDFSCTVKRPERSPAVFSFWHQDPIFMGKGSSK